MFFIMSYCHCMYSRHASTLIPQIANPWSVCWPTIATTTNYSNRRYRTWTVKGPTRENPNRQDSNEKQQKRYNRQTPTCLYSCIRSQTPQALVSAIRRGEVPRGDSRPFCNQLAWLLSGEDVDYTTVDDPDEARRYHKSELPYRSQLPGGVVVNMEVITELGR